MRKTDPVLFETSAAIRTKADKVAGFIGYEDAGFDAKNFDEFNCSTNRQLHTLASSRQHIDQRVNRELDGFLIHHI